MVTVSGLSGGCGLMKGGTMWNMGYHRDADLQVQDIWSRSSRSTTTKRENTVESCFVLFVLLRWPSNHSSIKYWNHKWIIWQMDQSGSKEPNVAANFFLFLLRHILRRWPRPTLSHPKVVSKHWDVRNSGELVGLEGAERERARVSERDEEMKGETGRGRERWRERETYNSIPTRLKTLERLWQEVEITSTHSLTHYLIISLSHSFTISISLCLYLIYSELTVSLTHSFTNSLDLSLTLSITQSLDLSLTIYHTHSLSHSMTLLINHSLTFSLSHSLTIILNHSLTHSITH